MEILGNQYYFSIIIIVISTLLYQICQKTIPHNMHPVVSLLITYLTASAVCMLALPFIKQNIDFFKEIKKVNWSIIVLGIVLNGIELGFLLAFRSGWSISKANLISSTVIFILLIPVGMLFFKEKLSMVNALGIMLCIVGVFLVGK